MRIINASEASMLKHKSRAVLLTNKKRKKRFRDHMTILLKNQLAALRRTLLDRMTGLF